MPPVPAIPQRWGFQDRDLRPLEYEDVHATAYNKGHRQDQRPGLHAYRCQYELECTLHGGR